MKIDYSPAIGGLDNNCDRTIRLSQGQELNLSVAGNKLLTQLMIGVGWDPKIIGNDMDIDSTVFVSNDTKCEKVYFGNLIHSSGCVVHHGDNLTGKNAYGTQGDDENISIYLEKVPPKTNRLVFGLNIYECQKRKQKLGDVKNLYIRICDTVSKKTLIEYKIDTNFQNCTAIVLGEVYRANGVWIFKAIGKGSYAKDIIELEQDALNVSLKNNQYRI